jgi:hypothetical protein
MKGVADFFVGSRATIDAALDTYENGQHRPSAAAAKM